MGRDRYGAARLRRGRARMHNLTTFDWSDLRYFLAVAREGSSLAAARALRVNQSTVHRRLVDLFVRAKFSQHEVDERMKDEAIGALQHVRDELRAAVAAASPSSAACACAPPAEEADGVPMPATSSRHPPQGKPVELPIPEALREESPRQTPEAALPLRRREPRKDPESGLRESPADCERTGSR